VYTPSVTGWFPLHHNNTTEGDEDEHRKAKVEVGVALLGIVVLD
jgi:hypothetical protein